MSRAKRSKTADLIRALDGLDGRFRDREHAGQVLARALSSYAEMHDLLVLGLPRGGVVVAFEVARELEAPLDVFAVRKLGVPGHEELALGAIASGGIRVLNEDVVEALAIDETLIVQIADAEGAELERRERVYRGDVPPAEIAGRTVLLVDDGLATGSTMRAAAAGVRAQEPDRVVVAVPVASRTACREVGAEVDQIVCLLTPEPLQAIGIWYEGFAQVSDDEVRERLHAARSARTEAHR